MKSTLQKKSPMERNADTEIKPYISQGRLPRALSCFASEIVEIRVYVSKFVLHIKLN